MDPTDYSRCIGTFKGGECNTKVVECYASIAGHYWWSSEIPIATAFPHFP